MSNFDDRLSRAEEEALLQRIVGDRNVLVLPHPNEILDENNKYDVLPGATVFRGKFPNDLLLARLRPKTTLTYSSTLGLTYAINNPESHNHFYPLYRSQLAMLQRYQEHIPNVRVSDAHVIGDDPYTG